MTFLLLHTWVTVGCGCCLDVEESPYLIKVFVINGLNAFPVSFSTFYGFYLRISQATLDPPDTGVYLFRPMYGKANVRHSSCLLLCTAFSHISPHPQ